ncbi:MAG: DUF3142 domain-containing protein [Tagaea sp.]|nr:DUF3142 domain-containing protein [Tagaea sp.]
MWGIRIAVVCALALTGSSGPGRELPHDVYVWQRVWTPGVAHAIARADDLIRTWRVLAGHSDRDGRLRPVAFDPRALPQGARPVLVVRIDGQLRHWSPAVLERDFRDLLAGWRAALPGGFDVEIDHDAGIARLADYAAFLGRARAVLAGERALSITALPAWLDSPVLPRVLRQTDEAVLQVHAVDDPRRGLFDAKRAEDWVARMGRASPVPFRVALPAYGLRVTWTGAGALSSVEAEIPLGDPAPYAREIGADPAELAEFARRLTRNPARGLVGIAWFRLPVEGDRRAWSLATWRNVVTRTPLRGDIGVALVRAHPNAPADIALVNRGTVDMPLPARVRLPQGCVLADGIGGYRIARGESGTILRREGEGVLRVAAERPIGWMRCAGGEGEFRVEH